MIPRILGIHLTGGFLDGEVIHFSDNLNCFIGGRGTGKSTAVRSVAYALGVDEKLTEQSNCPETVVVYCEDAAGVMYRYERGKGWKTRMSFGWPIPRLIVEEAGGLATSDTRRLALASRAGSVFHCWLASPCPSLLALRGAVRGEGTPDAGQ